MVSIHGPLGYEPNTLTTAPLRSIYTLATFFGNFLLNQNTLRVLEGFLLFIGGLVVKRSLPEDATPVRSLADALMKSLCLSPGKSSCVRSHGRHTCWRHIDLDHKHDGLSPQRT